MTEAIRYEAHDHVRLITIDQADKMNALDFAASDALIDAFQRFDADDDARVAVLTGAGDEAFSAGADLKTYTMAFAGRSGPEFRREFTNGHGLGGITRNLEIYKPILAAVNGYAMSGGLELALACDIRFASPNAVFAFQDVRWGFHPCDGGCVRLPQIVGLGVAMEMVLSGNRYDADFAARVGLVNRVISAERLVAETLEYAQTLASRAPLAQQAAKEVLLRAYGQSLREALALESRSFHDLGRTADLEEGTTAFRERRPANFEGR